MQKKVIIYQSNFNEVGGCETFIYNLVEQLKDWYDLLIIYDDGSSKQISRIKKYSRMEIYDKDKEYACDILIQNSMWGKINDKIKADRVIGMVHTDYQALQTPINIQFDKIDEFVACGENASKKFTGKYGVKCTPIKNILGILRPTQRVYHFVSAGRLSDDKGWDKMQIMIGMLRKAGILFDWTIFTNNLKPSQYEEVRFMKPRYDIWSYLKDADYGVLLSRAEGYPYFVSECLQYGTPVIGTDVSGINEIIQNGVNGYLVPLNMNFDINIIKDIPIVRNYTNGTTIETWKEYLKDAEYKEREIVNMKYLVKFNERYKDSFFNDSTTFNENGKMIKRDKNSEPWEVDEERKDFLLKYNAIIVLEEIKIEEIKKEITKEDKQDKKEVKAVKKAKATK